jgi:hypothetical protein
VMCRRSAFIATLTLLSILLVPLGAVAQERSKVARIGMLASSQMGHPLRGWALRR